MLLLPNLLNACYGYPFTLGDILRYRTSTIQDFPSSHALLLRVLSMLALALALASGVICDLGSSGLLS